ncbi:MAG: LacI family DNA-binding transcriptional regulator [Armatimonadetes bacterium]|nr:LacI family DNA-binding transcriptional regulator [Armatimonadota bacterium]
MEAMAVTLKDIAERTGVSPSVVSTVLSGRDNGTFVSEQTRSKVIQVAEMLHYTPVRSGRPRGSRRLRRQREEHFIGVWDPVYSPNTAHYIQNLQAALHRHAEQSGAGAEDDYGLRLLTTDDLPRLDAIGIMGLVLVTPELLPREAAAATIPCVMLGEADGAPRDLVQVHADNAQEGCLLGEYLWGLGHRRAALLASSARPRVAFRRFQGLQSVWTERGGDPALVLPVRYDKDPALSEREQVRQAVLSLYGPNAPQQNRPTALLCADEHVAAVAAQTLAEIGLRVPADVSLAAFGDTPRLGEAMTPPLTTVREPVAQLAAAAITQLYRLHEAKVTDDPEQHDLAFPGELVMRASCAPPAA